MSLLTIENLSLRFKGAEEDALKNITLNLNPGETLGIVGESGSGKSLTSLAIMGLLPSNALITKGSIGFNTENVGYDLLSLRADERRSLRGTKMAMIFQEPMTSLNPVLTCGYQTAESIKVHEHIEGHLLRNRVLQLFEQVKLPRPEELYESYPHQLSGGQRQRVMIAMALACNPALLIADEPTTALDVTVQKDVIDLLKSLQQSNNMGMIFISHDLGVVASLAQQIAVMYKGEIVEAGSSENILKSPAHPYTKGLLACRPPRSGRPKRLQTVSEFLKGDIMDTLNAQAYEKPDAAAKSLLLSVRDVNKHYITKTGFFGKAIEKLDVLKGISFDLYQGETLGLVGESGCGKSTLGRSILGLIHPDSGTITYKGKNLSTLNASELQQIRQKIQIIFQDPYSSLNPKFTVEEAIVEPMRVHKVGRSEKERKNIAIELLEKTGLSEKHLRLYPHEFSGGQRQRICIARCLALKPDFIICDESVSALDVSVQAQVLNLLNDLKREYGLTYIFISHDLSVVRYMSDRVIVMKSGQIEEEGAADDVYYHPKSAYTSRLLASIPSL